MQVSPVSAYLPRTVYQIQKRGAVTLVTMGNRGCGAGWVMQSRRIAGEQVCRRAMLR
jgi:hypothetical protein